MGPKDLFAALSAGIKTEVPSFIWGPPGVGKSSIVDQLCEEENLALVDPSIATMDAVDVRGVPMPLKGRTVWTTPYFLPIDPAWKGVIFLDEITQAAPLVQAAVMQLTFARRIGEYELPDGARIIAAGNRQSDRAGAHRIITPLLNRFRHLDLEVNNEEWHEWASRNGIAYELRAYIKFKAEMLWQFDPKLPDLRAFPTPRSWEFVSHDLAVAPAHLLQSMVAGCVGEGAAAEFVAFLRIFRDLPQISLILKDPKGIKVPEDAGVLYALSGAIAHWASKASPKEFLVMLQYIERMDQEFQVFIVRDAMIQNKNLASLDEVLAWYGRNKDVIAPSKN